MNNEAQAIINIIHELQDKLDSKWNDLTEAEKIFQQRIIQDLRSAWINAMNALHGSNMCR